VKRRDEPVPMREAIAAVGRDLGLAAPDILATITEGWVDIVGPTIAEHAQVRSVRNGECTIVVDGPAFATQLRYGSSDLVARVNNRCGAGSVTAIKVVVSGSRNA
jgi:predicted nucleic acid-binding Zn ribbon protein